MAKGPSSLFPASQRDVSRLKQSATDAVNDFGTTAGSHVSKVRGQLRDLAGHLQEESGDGLGRAKDKVYGIAGVVRDFAVERPLVCLGVALAIGFLWGASRRSSSSDD